MLVKYDLGCAYRGSFRWKEMAKAAGAGAEMRELDGRLLFDEQTERQRRRYGSTSDSRGSTPRAQRGIEPSSYRRAVSDVDAPELVGADRTPTNRMTCPRSATMRPVKSSRSNVVMVMGGSGRRTSPAFPSRSSSREPTRGRVQSMNQTRASPMRWVSPRSTPKGPR